MTEDVKTVHDIVDIVRRRRMSILIPAAVIFVVAAVAAVLLPKTYRSTATILIEAQEIPREYVTANVTTFADQRLQSINQRIMSATKLLEIIKRFNLYADMKSSKTMDEIVGKMRKDIKFNTISADVIDPRTGRPAQATIAFSVSYQGQNPSVVQQVASELSSLYLEENLKVREKQSLETSKFMNDEVQTVQTKLTDIESKIAAYKQKHITALPELSQVNMQGLDMAERDVTRLQDELRTLLDKQSYLEQQLVSIPPDTTANEKDQLKALKARLVELKARYSDEYPDVVKVRAAIRDLERHFASSGMIAGTKPDNPAYITLSSQLAGVKSEIDSVRRQLKDLSRKRDSYRGRMEATPRVEEGYKALMVERNNLQAKLDDLTKKAMDAKVAHGLEKEQLGERFTLVDAPRLPEKPASPNVPAILLIGLVLGSGAGIGLAALQESADRTVRTPEALARGTGLPVLAAIPAIVLPSDVEAARVRRKKGMAVAAGAVVAGIVIINLFVIDLDVLWARVARKLFP